MIFPLYDFHKPPHAIPLKGSPMPLGAHIISKAQRTNVCTIFCPRTTKTEELSSVFCQPRIFLQVIDLFPGTVIWHPSNWDPAQPDVSVVHLDAPELAHTGLTPGLPEVDPEPRTWQEWPANLHGCSHFWEHETSQKLQIFPV